MDDVLVVQVDESLQNLVYVLSTDCFAKLTIAFAKICDTSAGQVFQVYTENIIFEDLSTKVLDDMWMLQVLVAIYLFLKQI